MVEHQQIELDYCPVCEGTWFDADELDLLLRCMKLAAPELMIENIVALPASEGPHKPLKCPVCGQGMKEVAIGSPAIHVDVCHRADGIWFDGGEVHKLLEQLAGRAAADDGAARPVFEFLGQVFKGKE